LFIDNDQTVLSRYRLEKAKEDLNNARVNLDNGFVKGSINRSYYAIFHATRAILALDFFDSRKHSGTIATFQKNYIKTGKFDKKYSDIIEDAFDIRNKSDYDDFYIISVEDAKEQLFSAKIFVKAVEEFLNLAWTELEN
jgi:uncharacterized protein (UPF0332 family)